MAKEKKEDKKEEMGSILKYGAKNVLNHGEKSLGGCCDTVALKGSTFTFNDLEKEAQRQGHKTITTSRIRDHFDHVNIEHKIIYTVVPKDKKFIPTINIKK